MATKNTKDTKAFDWARAAGGGRPALQAGPSNALILALRFVIFVFFVASWFGLLRG